MESGDDDDYNDNIDGGKARKDANGIVIRRPCSRLNKRCGKVYFFHLIRVRSGSLRFAQVRSSSLARVSRWQYSGRRRLGVIRR